jgi:hypothetical protein
MDEKRERKVKHPTFPTTFLLGMTVTEDGIIPITSTKVINQRKSSDNERKVNKNTCPKFSLL